MSKELVDLTEETSISLDVQTLFMESSGASKEDIKEEIELINSQILDVSQLIQDLFEKRESLESRKLSLELSLSENGLNSTSDSRDSKSLLSTSSNSSTKISQTSIDQFTKSSLEKWSGTFEWSKRLENLAKSYFSVRSFRYLQREVLNAIISGQDCFVVMPTGAGKESLLSTTCSLLRE